MKKMCTSSPQVVSKELPSGFRGSIIQPMGFTARSVKPLSLEANSHECQIYNAIEDIHTLYRKFKNQSYLGQN
jgi:hypothetical protein